jgi:hypothetical protein
VRHEHDLLIVSCGQEAGVQERAWLDGARVLPRG